MKINLALAQDTKSAGYSKKCLPYVRIPRFQNMFKRLYKSTSRSGQKCLLSGGGNTPGRDASLIEEGIETGSASGHGGKQSAGLI